MNVIFKAGAFKNTRKLRKGSNTDNLRVWHSVSRGS